MPTQRCPRLQLRRRLDEFREQLEERFMGPSRAALLQYFSLAMR